MPFFGFYRNHGYDRVKSEVDPSLHFIFNSWQDFTPRRSLQRGAFIFQNSRNSTKPASKKGGCVKIIKRQIDAYDPEVPEGLEGIASG